VLVTEYQARVRAGLTVDIQYVGNYRARPPSFLLVKVRPMTDPNHILRLIFLVANVMRPQVVTGGSYRNARARVVDVEILACDSRQSCLNLVTRPFHIPSPRCSGKWKRGTIGSPMKPVIWLLRANWKEHRTRHFVTGLRHVTTLC
jgi:hypothetical protein